MRRLPAAAALRLPAAAAAALRLRWLRRPHVPLLRREGVSSEDGPSVPASAAAVASFRSGSDLRMSAVATVIALMTASHELTREIS